jgi:hypothetical protein
MSTEPSADLEFDASAVGVQLHPRGASSKLSKSAGVSKVCRSRYVAGDAVGTVPTHWVEAALRGDTVRSVEDYELEVHTVLLHLFDKVSAKASPAGFRSIIDISPVHRNAWASPELDTFVFGDDDCVVAPCHLAIQPIIISGDDDGSDDVEVSACVLKDMLEEVEMSLVRGLKEPGYMRMRLTIRGRTRGGFLAIPLLKGRSDGFEDF